MSGTFLTSDLSAVFSTADFSVAATYTPDGGSPTTVNGVFDDEDLEVDAGDGSLMIQRGAKFTCASADVSSVSEDDTFTIEGNGYTVSYVKNDGTGVIEIFLQRWVFDYLRTRTGGIVRDRNSNSINLRAA